MNHLAIADHCRRGGTTVIDSLGTVYVGAVSPLDRLSSIHLLGQTQEAKVPVVVLRSRVSAAVGWGTPEDAKREPTPAQAVARNEMAATVRALAKAFGEPVHVYGMTNYVTWPAAVVLPP